jgi:hypothetical protein
VTQSVLVLQFPVASTDDYDAVVELEERLMDELRDSADVDGHDVGGGVMNVFVFTDDPSGTLDRALRVLGASPLAGSLRAGSRREDEDTYTPLWPEGLDRFSD